MSVSHEHSPKKIGAKLRAIEAEIAKAQSEVKEMLS